MRPRSAVESWVSFLAMSTQMPPNSGHEDLRPLTQGLTIVPRDRSSSRPPSGDFLRRNALKSDSASSVQSVADEGLSLMDIENLLSEKVAESKDDLKAAFEAFDQEGNRTVTKGEFRRVIEGFLIPLTESQFDHLLTKIAKRENETIPYMEFLRKYCKVSSAANRISYMRGRYRNWSLGELQCRLKDKIGGNLKNITRAFRLFDYNRDGQIQQHELRKVLDGYCFPLSQQEFHRLWSHYSPNNAETISYKGFLEKLGVDCENYRKIAPDSIKLALSWDGVNRDKTRPKSKTSVRMFSGKTRATLDEVQTIFLNKMKKNLSLVEKALQAFDITGSGFVSPEDLRSILSNFIIPMDDSTFSGLLSRFRVSTTEPIQWRTFLGLFRDDKSQDDKTVTLNVLPLLKEAFLDVDKNRTGFINRDDLCRVMENLTFRLTDEHFKVLSDLLDAKHTDVINYQQLLDLLHNQPVMQTPKLNQKTPKPLNSSTVMKTKDAVEQILKKKLSENYDILVESIAKTTQNQSATIPAEDLRRLIQQYGLPLSNHHFSKLCEPFLVGVGVNYRLFLRSLGIPEKRDGAESNKGLGAIEREEKVNEARMLNIKTQAVEDIVLQKLRDGLQRRGMTLQDCLMSTRKGSTGVLNLRDFSKILDDCSIFLEGPQFQNLLQSLGFDCGEIPLTEFVSKYEEATTKEEDKEPDVKTKNVQATTLLSAEDCLSQLSKRITEYHGDVLSAFRFMDKNRDGIVNRSDFRNLFDSLMFVTNDREYQRLLNWMGLAPGATLNYSEFCSKIHSKAKPRKHDNILGDELLDQVHDHLAAIAYKGSSELSKAFCQLGEDGESIMTKNDMKKLLFKYYLPITPNEFEKLWARYDEQGNGFLTQKEFVRKLHAKPEDDNQSDTLQEQPTDRTDSTITHDTEDKLQNLRKWIRSDFENVSGNLVVLDKERDGHVTVRDLLSFLCRHGFQLKEAQLIHLLNFLGFDTCDKKLPYLDFLKRLAGYPVLCESAIDFSQGPSMDSSMGSPEPVESVEDLSPERAIQKLRELVTNSSDTLNKAFSAFDKSGGGMITQVEFRQVLDHFCIRLSEVQFQRLLSKISLSEGEDILVYWKKFLEDFSLHKQETADEWLKKVQKMRFPNQIRPLLMGDILRRIQEVVSARLYTITKEIVDLDYANLNTISKEDFKTICDRHFLRLTDDQFQNLWKMLPVNTFGNLEYREFLKKFSGEQKGLENAGRSLPGSARSIVDRPVTLRRPKTAPCRFGHSSSSGSEKLKRPSTSSRRHTPLLNCEDVEMKVRPWIQDKWRDIQRRCRDADVERTGEIDADTFLEILQGLRIDLSPSEFEQLIIKYDMKNSGRVSYPDFLRNFVLMFSAQVKTSTCRLKLHPPRTPMSAGPLSGQCLEAMLRMSRPVQLFWRQMRQTFVSFDKERTGKISLQDFRKVLRQYSVNLSEEEFFHLTSFFDKNISGKISYNDFLRIFLK